MFHEHVKTATPTSSAFLNIHTQTQSKRFPLPTKMGTTEGDRTKMEKLINKDKIGKEIFYMLSVQQSSGSGTFISCWVVMRRPLWKPALTLEEVNTLLPFSVCN